jgi:hypothetical protein
MLEAAPACGFCSITAEFNRRLALATAAIEDAADYEREHGMIDHNTRNLPATVVRELHRWQSLHTERT